jgi:branched-chain amino acid transport system substrate-binding protein
LTLTFTYKEESMPRKFRFARHALALWLGLALAACLPAAAADILVGQTAGFTGPVAAGVKETTDGALLYIDSVNKKGGVNGQQVKLISLDDKFLPANAAENARKLVEDDHVVALFLTRGTPHTQAVLPIVKKYNVPLVAPSTGAMVLHEPVIPQVFNVRATYQREAEKAIDYLTSIGVTRIAILRTDDTFGEDAEVGAMRGIAAAKLKPVVLDKFPRMKPDLKPLADAVMQANAQSVLIIGSGTVVANALKAIRAVGSNAQILTLSNNASTGFIKSLGPAGEGVIVSQVFPYERSLSYLLVKEARELLKSSNGGDLSPQMLEGFAGAKVLVEGLRRAGPNPTREKLLAALDNMHYDIGGLQVDYSPTDHTGLDFADLSIIGADGKFRR